VRTWRADLYLYCSAAAAIAILAPPVSLYWDSFGYVVQAITGQVGGLGLGRPLFILISHGLALLWFAVGGSAAHLEPVLRLAWAAVSCAAAPLTWRLARRASLSARAAAFAGLAVAVSPAMAHVSGSVLTDGPATSLCLLASLLGVHAILDSGEAHAVPGRRSVRLAAGAGIAIGVAIGLREQSVLGAAGLAFLVPLARPTDRWRLAGTMLLAAALVVAGPILFVWATQPGYVDTIRTWLRGMAHDREVMTRGWRDVGLFALWLLAMGPAVTVAAATAWARPRGSVWQLGGVLLAVSAPALAQLVLAAGFRGISYSPRFLLPAFPGALAIPGAWAVDRWIGRSRARVLVTAACLVVPLIVAAPYVQARAAPLVATLQNLPGRLAELGPTAVIVTGQPCPAIALDRAILAHDAPSSPGPTWQAICPGWAWPKPIAPRLDEARRGGRLVVLDLRPTSWIGAEQQAALGEITAYQRVVASGGTAPTLIVWR
jgi:hypothetical protein